MFCACVYARVRVGASVSAYFHRFLIVENFPGFKTSKPPFPPLGAARCLARERKPVRIAIHKGAFRQSEYYVCSEHSKVYMFLSLAVGKNDISVFCHLKLQTH